jgi:ribosome-binding protein aMBF1 (putative translation factor)
MKCNNCGTAISCGGCQIRIASDGKQVCSFCLPAYEQQIKIHNSIKTKQP